MFKVGDYVVYKRNVCKVKEIKEKRIMDKDYYILTPIDDESLTIELPVSNNSLRIPIGEKEILNLIAKIPSIEVVVPTNCRLIENCYRDLMKTGNLEDLVAIIKTSYLRISDKKTNGKKVNEKDSNYFKLAEKSLYNEIAVSLNITYDEAKNYIVKEVTKLINN